MNNALKENPNIDNIRKKFLLACNYTSEEFIDINLTCLILPLLVYKRLSDLEIEISKSNFPSKFNFQNILNNYNNENLSEKVKYYFNEFKKDYGGCLEGLEGLFNYNFSDEFEELGFHYNQLLFDLIKLFNTFSLSEKDISSKDLSKICLDILESKNTGLDILPSSITALVSGILDPSNETSIHDPFAYNGEILISCANYVENKEGKLSIEKISGQEKFSNSILIAKMMFILSGIISPIIKVGSVIQAPKFVINNKLQAFDRIGSCIPFNKTRRDLIASFYNDEYYRFRYGIPPKTKSEFLDIQHIIATLTSNGKACVVVSSACLSRIGVEEKIRELILYDDLIEAVIALPQNIFLFDKSFSIIVFNKNKNVEREKKVLFIDCPIDSKGNKKEGLLNSNDIEHILNVYNNFTIENGFSDIVKIADIIAKESNLAVGQYIEKIIIVKEDNYDIKANVQKMIKIEKEAKKANEQFNSFIKELGY